MTHSHYDVECTVPWCGTRDGRQDSHPGLLFTPWTTEDDEYLLASTACAADIGKALGRTPGAVRLRRHRLRAGLVRRVP